MKVPRADLSRAILAVPLLVSAILLACGSGDGDSQDADSATRTPEATVGSSSGGSPSPTARPGATTTAAPAASGTATSLAELRSYRYSLRMEGTARIIAEISDSTVPTGVDPNTGTLVFEARGSYVRPDRGEYTISLAGQTVRRVTIGTRQWLIINGVAREPTTLGAPNETDYSYLSFAWDDDSWLKDYTCSNNRETVNGISTRKCSADRATLDRLNRAGELFSGLSVPIQQLTTATADLWVTDNNKPVRASLSLTGADSAGRNITFKLEINITDINASLTINPPS